MSTLTVGEYLASAGVAQGFISAQTVSIGATTTSATTFNSGTRRIRVCSDVACQFEIGASPAATASSQLLPANAPEYFDVVPGKSWTIAVISNQL